MVIELTIVTRDGQEQVIHATEGRSLMEAIRDNGVSELLALCGGCQSCATCHVYVDPKSNAALPPRGNDEQDLLEASSHVKENSRLSCQITVTLGLSGTRVEVAPED